MVNLRLLLICLYIFRGKLAIGDFDTGCFLSNTRNSGVVLMETTYTKNEACTRLCLTYTSCRGVAISPTSGSIKICYILGVHSTYTDMGWQYADRTCFAGDSTDTEADFRIVDQYGLNSDNFGLLLYNGGTVCDDRFDQNAANAICSLLGYAASGSSWVSEYRWSQQNQYSITLGDVNCPTSSWSTCTYSESPNCRHSEDVFLICLTRVPATVLDGLNWVPFSVSKQAVITTDFSDQVMEQFYVKMPCEDIVWFKLFLGQDDRPNSHIEIYSRVKGNIYCNGAGAKSWHDGEITDFTMAYGAMKCEPDDKFLVIVVEKTAHRVTIKNRGKTLYNQVFRDNDANCRSPTTKVKTQVWKYPGWLDLAVHDSSVQRPNFRIVDQYGENTDHSGLLLYNGGTVCNDRFNQNAANAICSLLGYAASDSSWVSEYRWYQQNQYSITLDDVNCQTSSWSTCTFSESPNCRHSEDVFLTCITRVPELKMVDKFGLDRKRYGLLLYNDGTVCGGNFDQNAADAICSLLEYANTGSKWESENRWSIQSDYRIAIENVNCRNNSWSSCTYSESYNCDHNEDVFLSCSDGSPDFRIVNINGYDAGSAGLLIYKGGTVCDDNFNQNAANAICSFLGYEAGDSKWTSGDKWSIQSEYRISLDDVTCRSDDWSACTYREYSNCQHGEDVFLTCNIRQEDFRIVDIEGHDAGASGLLLYKGGTVCDDNFNQNAANAICSFLGYDTGGSEWNSGYRWSAQSEYSISLDDVTCRSNDWSACTYRKDSNCVHDEDVFLICKDQQKGKMKKKRLSAGGIVGIVAAVVAVIFGVIMYRKRKHRQRSQQIDIDHTRDNNIVHYTPIAPEQADTVQGRTGPDVIAIPALGASNLAPPPYTEVADVSGYGDKIPTYEEAMADGEIYDVAQDDS